MKAIALVSGGLDSTLAVGLIKEQGIEVIGLNFKTPFCLCDRKAFSSCSIGKYKSKTLGITLRMVNVTEDFFKILKKPKYGYGSNMNPCIDCRILAFSKAREFMQEVGAKFVVTGEVLGQRPMSQHRQALKIIEKESGLEGLVLRPLSAKLLAETTPEKKGWVQRDKLLNFAGRSRKPQMELAKRFNIIEYPCSSGGCLLTDPEFSKRIKDLMIYQELNLNNVELLKAGRLFKLSENTRVVVGRNEQENERLKSLVQENDYLFSPLDLKGPTALGRGIFNDELVRLSCSIVCRYCDLDGKLTTKIVYKMLKESVGRNLEVLPIEEDRLANLRI